MQLVSRILFFAEHSNDGRPLIPSFYPVGEKVAEGRLRGNAAH